MAQAFAPALKRWRRRSRTGEALLAAGPGGGPPWQVGSPRTLPAAGRDKQPAVGAGSMSVTFACALGQPGNADLSA